MLYGMQFAPITAQTNTCCTFFSFKSVMVVNVLGGVEGWGWGRNACMKIGCDLYIINGMLSNINPFDTLSFPLVFVTIILHILIL